MEMLKVMKEWILARLAERTSWDGASIIALSVCILVASPLVGWLAWAGLVYGVYTLIKEQ
jgi:hypothetical protein